MERRVRKEKGENKMTSLMVTDHEHTYIYMLLDPDQMCEMHWPHVTSGAGWIRSGPNTQYKCKSIGRRENPNYRLDMFDM